MANQPDRETVFGKAIAEHLEVIRGVEAQQDVLEAIARLMADALHRATRSCGAATVAVPVIRSTWRRRSLVVSGASGAACLRLR